MKKLYLAIITLALAIVLVTGCGDKTGNFQSDSYTETRSRSDRKTKSNKRTSSPDINDEAEINSQGNNDYQDNEGSQLGSRAKTRSRSNKDTTSGPDLGRLFERKPKVKIDVFFRYVWQQGDTERKHPVLIEFDLEGYLTAYGATEIRYLGADERGIMYGVKFENGIFLRMLFSQHLSYDDYYCDYDLTNIAISACKPDYDFTSYDDIDYASFQDVEGLASWSKEYYVTDVEVDDEDRMSKKYDWLSILRIDKFYDNDKSFYSDGPTKSGRFLLVPIDFDSIFRKLVVPYLELKRVSFESDPFEDREFQE